MSKIFNLVFEGGGVLGIAYLGVLKYLYENNIMKDIKRAAGTSAGAITACITSFRLTYDETKQIVDSLDYRRVPEKEDIKILRKLPSKTRNELERIFGDLGCLYRLVNNYGWYSSKYFYTWLQEHIASQFNQTKKLPPYTFRDFKNPLIHKDNRSFLDLYIIGTDMSCKASKVFSYKTTPDMEVAEAVRISMSIPLFFEAIRVDDNSITKGSEHHIFSDGGVMRNYAINIFDVNGTNPQTLGIRFKHHVKCEEINNLEHFISNYFLAFTQIQQDLFNNSPLDIARSIQIDTEHVSPVDFDIETNDDIYDFLFNQGYEAAKRYFYNIPG
jgi:NTE family protein